MSDELGLRLPLSLEPSSIKALAGDAARDEEMRMSASYLFVFVARGWLRVDDEGSQARLGPSEALLLFRPGDCSIGLHCEDGAKAYAVAFRKLISQTDPGASKLAVPVYAAVANPERLTDLLRMQVVEQGRKSPSPAILSSLLVLTLSDFAASAGGKRGFRRRGSEPENLASLVDAYIAAHYRESISSIDIARYLNYSVEYIKRVFLQRRGMSIRDAIHRRRVKEASALLASQRGSSISEIAAMCGYRDVGYFRRVFKRLTETTPSSLRCGLAQPGPGRGA